VKILLRKIDGVFTAALGGKYGLSGGGNCTAPTPLATLAFALVLMLLPVLAVLALVAAAVVPHGSGMLLATAPAILAPAKHAQANELRAQARALWDEIGDVTKPLTADELQKKKDAADALTLRAQFLAGHTADAEIERQGGESALADRLNTEAVQRVTPEELAKQHIPANLRGRIEKFRAAITQHFGGTANYCRAARGQLNVNTKQQAVLEEAKQLTRTIVGTASDASGGEFLLPLEQEQSVFRLDNTIPGLLQRARLYSMKGRTKRIPALVQDNDDLTRPLSSISAITIVGEGSAKPVREPVFRQVVLTAYKYAAISKIADEMLDDDFTGDLEPAMVQAVGQEVLNQINYDVTIAGGGSTAPVGALHTSANPALIKVTRETQNRIKFGDAVNMYTRHTHGPNSFWLISRRAIGEVMQFELSAGSPLTFLQNMAQNPANAMLLGYPIIVSDFLNSLGSEGDFALVNPDHYAAALRRQLTVESSIHVEFVNDVTTWRFFARGGGVPIPQAPYAYRSAASTNVDPHSPFVVLDDVYV
jgi:HK97 family phage major capsid protein